MSAAADDASTPPSQVTDADLLGTVGFYLEQCLRGQKDIPDDAWQRFYATYEPLLRCFARRCGVPADQQDDCVQEALRTVVVSLKDFEYDAHRGRFRGWLFSIVRSRATDLMRRRIRWTSRHDQTSCPEEQADTSMDVGEEMDRRWRSAVIQIVVERLREQVSPKNFEVFRLRSIEGMSVPEVSTELGSTPERVRYRHHRTLRKFRELYLVFTGEDYKAD